MLDLLSELKPDLLTNLDLKNPTACLWSSRVCKEIIEEAKRKGYEWTKGYTVHALVVLIGRMFKNNQVEIGSDNKLLFELVVLLMHLFHDIFRGYRAAVSMQISCR